MAMNLYELALIFVLINISVVALVCVAIFIIWIRSNKPFRHLWAEIVYELNYNGIGAKALLEDIIMRERLHGLKFPQETGKVALVTGGARGIGVEIVKLLIQCDMQVIIGCRNVTAGQNVLKSIREEGITTGEGEVFELDLASLESVKSFAAAVKAKYPKIHVLVNNAGKMFGPYMESVDGFESQFAVNYLGHFLLTHLLMPQIIAAGERGKAARIVNVTSCAHTVGEINMKDINNKNFYIPSAAYAQSKLAQILFTNYVNYLMRSQKIPVNVYSVHPGIVDTELFNGTHLKNIVGPWLLSRMFKTPKQGAASIAYACLSEKVETSSGCYVSNCDIYPTCRIAYSTILQEKFFEFTKDLLSIKEFGKE